MVHRAEVQSTEDVDLRPSEEEVRHPIEDVGRPLIEEGALLHSEGVFHPY